MVLAIRCCARFTSSGKEYFLQIRSVSNTASGPAICSGGSIHEAFAVSGGFALAGSPVAWDWPLDNGATIIEPGRDYNVIFHGLFHLRRYAYQLKLMASIDGFNPATAATHSWQVRMPHGNAQAITQWAAEQHPPHNLTAHPLETKEIPNWLGFNVRVI